MVSVLLVLHLYFFTATAFVVVGPSQQKVLSRTHKTHSLRSSTSPNSNPTPPIITYDPPLPSTSNNPIRCTFRSLTGLSFTTIRRSSKLFTSTLFTNLFVRPLELLLPTGRLRTTAAGRQISLGRFVIQPALVVWYWGWLLVRYSVGYERNKKPTLGEAKGMVWGDVDGDDDGEGGDVVVVDDSNSNNNNNNNNDVPKLNPNTLATFAGKYKLLVDVKFKDQYDEYLKALGQNQLFRNIAKSIVGNTLEELELVENDDANNGDPHLRVKGTNARGIWTRILKSNTTVKNASGVMVFCSMAEFISTSDPKFDSDVLHVSEVEGDKGEGVFRACRWVEKNSGVYVCESSFFKSENCVREGVADAKISWRFGRAG